MSHLLEEAGKLNILLDSDEIWEEKPTVNQQKIGDDFSQQLLVDKATDFTNPIAEHANIIEGSYKSYYFYDCSRMWRRSFRFRQNLDTQLL